MSCVSNNSTESENSNVELNISSSTNSDYDIILPPVDLLFDLQSVNLKFNPESVNAYENIDKYVSQRSKTLNLGIYLSDLSYLSAVDDRALMPKYMQNIKFLTDELKIIGLFDKSTLNRYRQNMENTDSIYYLSLETHDKMVDILESTNRASTLVHIYIGGFIESFYLFVEPIKDSLTYQEISDELQNYQFVFNEYYGYAKKMVSDPFLGETVNDLSELIQEFKKFDAKLSESKAASSDITDNSQSDSYYQPDYHEFKRIRVRVIQLRNHFIQLK